MHKTKNRKIPRSKTTSLRKKLAKKSFFGFSIPELLVAVAIIVILSALVAIAYVGVTRQAVVRSLQSDLVNASRQLHLDQVTDSSFPLLLSQANSGQGIAASPETTYIYAVDDEDNPQEFCVAATKSDITYSVTNNEPPIEGGCKSFGIVMNADAGSSSSYPGTGISWNDTSGNGNNGTISGAEYSTEGGGAFRFDGIDDYIDYGVLPPMKSYTFSVWVKMDMLTGGNADQQQYGWTIGGTSSNYGMWLTVGGSIGPEAALRAYSSRANGHPTIGADLNTTEWFNIVATAKKDSISKIYINGVEKGSFTADVINWAGHLTLGDLRPNRHIGFAGYMSEIQIHNRVLSADEIQQYYNDSRARYGR
jgi:prepilin-type N-terminal cleavage/methylation domain-containing protein